MPNTPFEYHFVRQINGRHWTIDILSDGKNTDITIDRGPAPFWHTSDDGTCIETRSGHRYSGWPCSRIGALRFAACAIANIHGGGPGSGGNNPGRPCRTWSPRRLLQLNREIQPTGPWIEYDCLDSRRWKS